MTNNPVEETGYVCVCELYGTLTKNSHNTRCKAFNSGIEYAMTNGIKWLSGMEYQKALTQFRLQLNGIFEPLFKDELLDIHEAMLEITKLAEDFGLRVRGIDKPISLEGVRAKRNKK